MKVFIGLGSNQGERQQNLSKAFHGIEQLSGATIQKVSTLYQSPAWVPEDCHEDWHFPFLNAAVQIDYSGTPETLLNELKEIEKNLGRMPSKRWAPRMIDLDILAFGNQELETEKLKIPHPGVSQRPFVLGPLRDLSPGLEIPGQGETVLMLQRRLKSPIPQWMNIVNLTPDSFSDGGVNNSEKAFLTLLEENHREQVSILDLGAESTRPGARSIGEEEEWQRLSPFIQLFQRHYSNQPFRPQLSIDTRHAGTAKKASLEGVQMINDVSGLSDPQMLSFLKEFEGEYVLMHSLSVPANPNEKLPQEIDVIEHLCQWLETKLHLLTDHGIDLNRIIFDPGIGFGKSATQSLEILKRFEEFKKYPVKILLGHSRKSFMKSFSPEDPRLRDPESLGMSLSFAQKGADIIRVHNAPLHIRAFRGWAHVQAQG